MKIAVTYENGQIYQHFGHTPAFKVYEVENDTIANTTTVVPGEDMHCALGGWLKENGIDTLICGGIGGGAINALSSAGIQMFPGCSGSADEAVTAFIAGNLEYDPETRCTEHEHDHDHTCAHH